MREGKRQERIEDSFLSAIRSEDEDPPQNVGQVWVSLRDERCLASEDAGQFRDEILQCVRAVDSAWPANVEWDEPQGYAHADFALFPCLQRYLTGLHFWSADRIRAYKEIAWITFPPKGSPYRPKLAVDALLKLLAKKAKKYTDPHVASRLEELDLVAYWNQGLIYNTPFFAPGFGFQDVALVAAKAVSSNPGPFPKIFLFNALPQDLELARLYP